MRLPVLGMLAGLIATCGVAACTEVPEVVVGEKSKYSTDQYKQAVEALQVDAPTMRSPLQFKAALIPSSAAPGERVRLVVKVRLNPGWHIYDYVPPNEPYKQTEWLMELGAGLQAVGEWNGPQATSYYSNPIMMVHEGRDEPLVFYRELVVGEDAVGELSVKAGMKYQTCDINMCMPTKQQVEELGLKIRE